MMSQKITFGEMRASGVRDVLIYCRDHRCSHSTTVSANRSPRGAWPPARRPALAARYTTLLFGRTYLLESAVDLCAVAPVLAVRVAVARAAW
jgi:hypothetical protein